MRKAAKRWLRPRPLSHQWKAQRCRPQCLQTQVAPEPENYSDPGGLSQPAGLWLSLSDAGHQQGGWPHLPSLITQMKYISFSLGQLWFIDSPQFLLASLSEPTRGIPNHSGVWIKPAVARASHTQEHLPLWVHRLLGKINRETTHSKKRPSTASFQTCTLGIRTTPTHRGSGRLSTAKPLDTTTTSTTAPMSCCSLMSSRPFGRPA